MLLFAQNQLETQESIIGMSFELEENVETFLGPKGRAAYKTLLFQKYPDRLAWVLELKSVFFAFRRHSQLILDLFLCILLSKNTLDTRKINDAPYVFCIMNFGTSGQR